MGSKASTGVRIETKKVSDLKPAPYNPRNIDEASLAGLTKSVERFGMVQPIIWNSRSGFVVGGHQRLKVIRSQKVRQTEVVVVDLDDTEERALNIALNSPHIAGEFTASLQGLLEEVEAANSALFHELRLGELLGEGVTLAPIGDPEFVPEIPKEARTKLGDVYVLGRHRLVCGDSTSVDTLDALLKGEKVDSLVTDPPYGVDYGSKNAMLNTLDGGNRNQKHIANDAVVDGGYRAWFTSWLAIVPWSKYATFFLFMSGTELHNLRMAVEDCGYTWGDYLIWVKNNHVLGRKDYNLKHEFVLYGWPERHKFYAEAHRTTVLEYARPQKSDLHPTMKPIPLVKQLVEDGSATGAIVLDLFGGSGTTMIACEEANRCARLVELDPLYCDVIVDRWQQFTGKTAELVSK